MKGQVYIQDNVLTFKHLPKVIGVVFFVSMIVSLGLGIGFLNLAFNENFSEIPRTLLWGISVVGLGSALLICKSFLSYRDRTSIVPNKSSIVEERRIFGKSKVEESPIHSDCYITFVEYGRVSENANGIDRMKTVYDISLFNGKTIIPLYSGTDKESSDKIKTFCKDNNIPEHKGKIPVNHSIMLVTVLFMVAVFCELYLTGRIG